jgi:hypothetical protein
MIGSSHSKLKNQTLVSYLFRNGDLSPRSPQIFWLIFVIHVYFATSETSDGDLLIRKWGQSFFQSSYYLVFGSI